MSLRNAPPALRRLVVERAQRRCEYCLLPADAAFFPHELDHIVAEKHGGATSAENLAYTCWRCNRHKGTDLGSLDPRTGEFRPLYNPRTQRWRDHFALEEGRLVGLSPQGEVTIRLLQFNAPDRVAERVRLLALGLYVIPQPRTGGAG